ncbi:hypothetical protein OPQ81_004754 [Rhizoctonia solani]|nr:hypothetical protein OPQ81_004754 [Rhizoctonia solani]
MSGQRNSSNSSSDVEIIEDSEPERQERLAKLRFAKKQSHNKNDSAVVGQAQTSHVTTLTELSALPASDRTASVINTRAPPREKDESQTSFRLANSSSLPVRRPAPPPWLASTTTSTPTDPPTNYNSPSRPVSLKSFSQPSPAKQLDLNSFTFRKRTIGRSASYSTSSRSVSGSRDKDKDITASESCSDAPKASTGSIKSSSSPKVFILGATKECPTTEASFTAEQINSLRCCVVCENAWTARKSPKHKWSHITSCARKGGCDLDTLYIKLIGAVVDASDAKGTKQTKAKAKEREKEPAEPQSLLAQTVQERPPPKKRGRRAEPGPSNLQPVGDTHMAILERGAALLGVKPVLSLEGQSDVTPGIPAKDHPTEQNQEVEENEPDLPATQGFAPSKMGGRSRLFGSTLATLNTDSRNRFRLLSNLSHPSVFLMRPRFAPPTTSSDSSIISISSSNDSDSNLDDLDTLGNRIPSPVLSNSSTSVLILDSTHSSISRQAPASSPSSTDFHASFHPSSRRQSFGEEWNSQEGVYKGEECHPSRPPSPTTSLADYVYEMSLGENEGMLQEIPRGRTRSPPVFQV